MCTGHTKHSAQKYAVYVFMLGYDCIPFKNNNKKKITKRRGFPLSVLETDEKPFPNIYKCLACVTGI